MKRIEEFRLRIHEKGQRNLAVSRSFGDFVYKQASLPPEKQAVSVEPEIKIADRRGGDEFLIFACDGIWDVMSNQQCCDYIRRQMAEESMTLEKLRSTYYGVFGSRKQRQHECCFSCV